jgi:putative addiction module CopG family antidote
MPYEFPTDLRQRIEAQIATGEYANENDVLRDAIRALEREKQDIAAIRAGIEDMEAGRYRAFDAADAELRKKHNIPQDA